MDVSEKIRRKMLAQDVFDRSWSLDGVKTLIKNISARLLIFAARWVFCNRITTRTRISDATAVTFSVKCFNPWKLYPVSGNIFRKWFASYFVFIHEHLIIMWSPKR